MQSLTTLIKLDNKDSNGYSAAPLTRAIFSRLCKIAFYDFEGDKFSKDLDKSVADFSRNNIESIKNDIAELFAVFDGDKLKALYTLTPFLQEGYAQSIGIEDLIIKLLDNESGDLIDPSLADIAALNDIFKGSKPLRERGIALLERHFANHPERRNVRNHGEQYKSQATLLSCIMKGLDVEKHFDAFSELLPYTNLLDGHDAAENELDIAKGFFTSLKTALKAAELGLIDPEFKNSKYSGSNTALANCIKRMLDGDNEQREAFQSLITAPACKNAQEFVLRDFRNPELVKAEIDTVLKELSRSSYSTQRFKIEKLQETLCFFAKQCDVEQIFAHNKDDLPKALFELSKTQYGLLYVQAVLPQYSAETLIPLAKTFPQVINLTESYEVNIHEAMILVTSDKIRGQLLQQL